MIGIYFSSLYIHTTVLKFSFCLYLFLIKIFEFKVCFKIRRRKKRSFIQKMRILFQKYIKKIKFHKQPYSYLDL